MNVYHIRFEIFNLQVYIIKRGDQNRLNVLNFDLEVIEHPNLDNWTRTAEKPFLKFSVLSFAPSFFEHVAVASRRNAAKMPKRHRRVLLIFVPRLTFDVD